MANDTDKESKTEAPSEKKIQDAREQGNVPFSREAATFASLGGIFIVANYFLPQGAAHMKSSIERFIENPGDWPLENSADVAALLSSVGMDIGEFLLPLVTVLTVVGMASSFLQNPPSLVFHRIKPDLSKLSPGRGFTRIFGQQGRVEFMKAVFKLSAALVVGYVALRSVRYQVLSAMHVELSAIPHLVLTLTLGLISSLAIGALILAGVDVAWSRFFWRTELRMTRQEVKDEMKQMEGDPLIKMRMRSIARNRARRRMIQQTPRATFVVANPTHYAVALRYVREEGGAPLVVAKGKNLIALKIREIAVECGIPIVEDKLLARSLYESVDIDELIPPEFYKAVAEIVYFLFVRRTQKNQSA
jgi:flagellar biosynthesis protein FlhB